MGQVIEVRLINSADGAILADRFTLTSSGNYDATSHEPMHREAIVLALREWSGGAATLKSIERVEDAQRTQADNSWRYIYECVLSGEDQDDKTDRMLYAVLFAQYREKQSE
jgi:hypothetical protein